jgi:transcriptional regulator with GAF, ATPase, and Fis domain
MTSRRHKSREGSVRICITVSRPTIYIPPLRERIGDLPLLIDHFLEKASQELGREKPAIPKELFDVLGAYSFPGNVRELEAMIFDAVSIHRSGILSTKPFRTHIGEPGSAFEKHTDENHGLQDNPFADWVNLPTLKDADRLLMEAALKRANNNLSVAAQLLGVSKQALGKRLKRSNNP